MHRDNSSKMEQNTATFTQSFFIEHSEVTELISILSDTTSDGSLEGGSSSFLKEKATALSKFRCILDRYLECPTLLDPYLEGMVSNLASGAKTIIHDLFFRRHQAVDYLEFMEEVFETENLFGLMHLLSAIYALSKVRGRKFIQRLLPHGVEDVEPVLAVLRWFGLLEMELKQPSCGGVDGGNGGVSNDRKIFERIRRDEGSIDAAKIWESIYSLLIWLGIISLVPFDLHTIDSSLENSTNDIPNERSMTLVKSILSTSASRLNDSGPTREAAAACLASLLSRPDLEQSELEGFVIWSAKIMFMFRTRSSDGMHTNNEMEYGFSQAATILPMPTNQPSVFLIMGILQTLAAVFKSGHRSNLLSTQQKLNGIELLWEQSILVAEGSIGSMLLRKFLAKLFARIGCSYLPPRVATWRYERGRRSLLDNLVGLNLSARQTEAHFTSTRREESTHGDENCVFLIPDQVEDAMDQLLLSLTDPSTVVRWSSAKGIGRLTERLPAICADDVLDALLQICSDPERDRNWHGVCLCLAELARRGLLLPSRLGEVIPIVVQAIGYDVRRGQHSVGAHVRDAACYTCWAFARAYSPEVLSPYVKELSVALVLASLFDREVNCRRAASAAFQESVGRQGADNFKHGIAILTAADYFSLGNRSDAYLNIAVAISKFDQYQRPIIQHVSRVKLHHWDCEVRKLASQSLARVSKLNPVYCSKEVLPNLLEQSLNDDLVVRHGSLLGAAEMTLAMGELDMVEKSDALSAEMKSLIAELVPSIEKARLYRGRGGEIMRSASCRMIECISLARIPLTVRQQVRLLDSIDACLVHPNESIQQSASRALKALLTNYFPVSSKGPSERLQSRVVDKYISLIETEDNPAATRGFTLALGSLPSKLLAPNEQVLNSVLSCLCNSLKSDSLVGAEGDAETRRNAVIALVNVCETVGICCGAKGPHISTNSSPVCPLTEQQLMRVFDALLGAMDDYNMDRRGDVGSWSRIASMKGLETISFLAIKSSSVHPHSTHEVTLNSQLVQSEATVPNFAKRLASFTMCSTTNDVNAIASASNATIFDENLCLSILSALLKQLGEKLDAVRNQAGQCLESLLTNDSPRIPFVPYRRILIRALNLDGNPKTWSNPANTFPLLMRAINIEGFLKPVLSGIVISVGGLTESVSKSSCTALFKWIKELRNARAIPKIIQMGEVLLSLLNENKRNGRVIMPLLITLDELLTHGYLDELLVMESGQFVDDLLTNLLDEVRGCTDVKRLLAIAGVTINLLQPDLQTIGLLQEKSLPLIMIMLLNPYPRVRKYVAEQLFAKLSVDGESMFTNHQHLEEASQLILNTVWHDEHDSSGRIAESRNRIADLLNTKLTKEERDVSLSKKKVTKFVSRDEFENYSSLINSTAS